MIPAGANDLFFVGDGHQRIYNRNRAAMGRCGIEIRGRSRKLYLNYRTTEEIRRQAISLLEGCEIDDLDDGHDENSRYKSLSHARNAGPPHGRCARGAARRRARHGRRRARAAAPESAQGEPQVPERRLDAARRARCSKRCGNWSVDSSTRTRHRKASFSSTLCARRRTRSTAACSRR